MTDRPPAPAALADHVAAGVLDAGLAALTWLLVEARVPVVVAGTDGRTASGLRAALVELLPADTRAVAIDGEREDFAWMPEAVELGWRRERQGRRCAGARGQGGRGRR